MGDDAIQMTIDRISNPNNYMATIESTLTRDLPSIYYESLENINGVIKTLTASENLFANQSLLMEANTLTSLFAKKLSDYFMSVAPNNGPISPKEAKFMNDLTRAAIVISTYSMLLRDIPNIDRIFATINTVSVLKEIDVQNIESILRVDGGPGGVPPIKEDHTFAQFSSLSGIDGPIRDIKSVIESRFILSKQFIFFMLTGPPGTGKSVISHAIATAHSNGNYFNLDLATISSSTVGVAEKQITNLFGRVEGDNSRNYTIVLDEMDNVFGNVTQAHIKNIRITLQTEISGHRKLKNNVIIIGITNHYAELDAVIRRRATNVIYIPPPENREVAMFFLKICSSNSDRKKYKFTFAEGYTRDIVSFFTKDPNLHFTNANAERLGEAAKSEIYKRSTFNWFTFDDAFVIFSGPECPVTNANQDMHMNLPVSEMRKIYTQSGYDSLVVIPTAADLETVKSQVNIMTSDVLEQYRKNNDPEAAKT